MQEDSGEIHAQTSLYSFPFIRRHTKCAFFSSKKIQRYMYNNVSAQESLLENQSSRFLLGADHIGIFCLASLYQSSRLQEGQQMLTINHIVCTNSLGTVSLPYQLGNDLVARFPDSSQRPTSHVCPSKVGSLRPALLILFFTLSLHQEEGWSRLYSDRLYLPQFTLSFLVMQLCYIAHRPTMWSSSAKLFWLVVMTGESHHSC